MSGTAERQRKREENTAVGKETKGIFYPEAYFGPRTKENKG